MAYTIFNYVGNSIELTNTDLSDPMTYSLYFLDDDQIFSSVSGYTSQVLAAGATITIDLVDDNVYKLVVTGSPDITYYFLLDNSLRTCKKYFTQKILCNPCQDPTDTCSKLAYIKAVYDYLKFKVLHDNMYWIWNKWVQDQSIVDIIVPPNGEVLYLADLRTKLTSLCSSCCDDSCGCSSCTSTTSSSTTQSNCGCS
jgi:hypothetical protein